MRLNLDTWHGDSSYPRHFTGKVHQSKLKVTGGMNK